MKKRLHKLSIALIGTIMVQTAVTGTAVLAAEEETQEVSMIEQLKKDIKKTDEFKSQDKSPVTQLIEHIKTETGFSDSTANALLETSDSGLLQKGETVNTVDYGVCANPGTSATKSYMDASTVTNTASRQYKLLQTMHINEQGFYATDDGFISVALGSYYGEIGDKYLVTLENGKTYKVIKTDEKSDEHVWNGCYHREDGSVMEMVIDEETAGNYWGWRGNYVAGGNFNNIPEFNGKITDIRKVEEDKTGVLKKDIKALFSKKNS